MGSVKPASGRGRASRKESKPKFILQLQSLLREFEECFSSPVLPERCSAERGGGREKTDQGR